MHQAGQLLAPAAVQKRIIWEKNSPHSITELFYRPARWVDFNQIQVDFLSI